jgi:soluble lytic murein transglycosylase
MLFSFSLLQGCGIPIPLTETSADPDLDQPEQIQIFNPEPTPSPTPLPKIRIENAEYEIFIGDYLQALSDYESALIQSTDPAEKAIASMGIGRVHYLLKDYPKAIAVLEELIINYPDSFQVANAYYFLGLCYQDTQRYAEAAAALHIFNSLRPGNLDTTIQSMRGDLLRKAGLNTEAIEAYQKAIDASPGTDTTSLQINIGRIYADMDDHINAVRTFMGIYETTTNDYTKAQMNLLSGISYMALGLPDQAYARYQDSVENYPKAYDTYTGLVELVNNNIPVNSLSRGIVNYFARQYGLAVDILNRYMDENPQHDGTPLFYKALCLVETGQQSYAIEIFDQIIEQYPDSRFWEMAWDEKSYTQWVYLGQYAQGANTLLNFVKLRPESTNAASYLFQAGRIFERSDQLDEAVAVWSPMIDKYPSAAESYRALFLTGIVRFRQEKYEAAKLDFQRYLVLAGNTEDASAAYFWIAKCEEKNGNSEGAQQAWFQSAQSDPTGYYSERALEILDNKPPLTSDGALNYDIDLATEKSIAEQWLRTTFSVDPAIDLNQLGELAFDENLRKGDLFWELGMYTEAVEQFNQTYARVKADPVQNFRLLNHLLDLHLYRPAIFISRNILDLANFSEVDTLTAPSYFNHIRFGIFYKDLVLSAAEKYQLEPYFLFSVIRQESLFEGFVQSSAGAAGLMQIMPATGDEINTQLSWPAGYTTQDLYRPVISIPFGAYYLKRQIDLFDGNRIAALASYNGGPGNTLAWNEKAKGDPDLLLEIIRFDETRNYIFNITENFHIYERLYQNNPQD